MSQDLDGKLGRLLREGGPPARDPMFRIGLLEVRERRRYRNRLGMLVAGSIVLAAAPASFVALASDLVTAGLAGLFGIGLLAAALVSARGALQVARRLRGS